MADCIQKITVGVERHLRRIGTVPNGRDMRRDLIVMIVGLIVGGLGTGAIQVNQINQRLARIETRIEAIKTPPPWFEAKVFKLESRIEKLEELAYRNSTH